MKKTLIALSYCLFIADLAHAAQNLVQQVQTSEPSKKIFTASLLIETSSTLAKESINSSGEDYSVSGLYRVDLGASLSDALTALLRAGYSQEYSYVLSDGSSGDFTDSRLGLTAALGEIRKDLKLSVSSSLTLPTSRVSQRAGLYSILGLSSKLVQTLNKFTFILSPGFNSSFHSVEVQNDGRLNNQYSINILLSAAYALNENLELSTSFQPTRSWTYLGTNRDKYFINYELGYKVSNYLQLALGIYNDASALKTNGLDYNYALFDQQQFMGYFDITLSL